MPSQRCPICRTKVSPSSRHPRYVCPACVALAQSHDGRRVEFSNATIFGGLAGRYLDNGERYARAQCFIEGVRCEAGEARFGGVVIEPVQRGK